MPKRPPSELWCKPGAHNTSELYTAPLGEHSLQEMEQSCAFTQRFTLSMALILMKSLGSNTARLRWKYKLRFFTTKLYLLQLFLRIVCYLLWELGDADGYHYQQDFVRAQSCASHLHVKMDTFHPSLHCTLEFCWAGVPTNKVDSVEAANGWVDVPLYWPTLYSSVLLPVVELMCYLDCMFLKDSMLLLLYSFLHKESWAVFF